MEKGEFLAFGRLGNGWAPLSISQRDFFAYALTTALEGFARFECGKKFTQLEP
jgi:hypothetical protein